MTLLELTKNRLEELKKVLSWCSSKLKAPSNGALYIRKERGKLRYYCHNAENNNLTYLGDDKTDQIFKLEEELYSRKLQTAAGKEARILEKMLKELKKSTSWETVYYDIPKDKRHLIKPLEINPLKVSKADIEKWGITRKANNVPGPNITVKGEYVKSKSELIIADRLERAGVPYHYEADLPVAEEKLGQFFVWHPDFKVLNTRTGKEYWWEHFGRMDNPDYFSTCNYKLMVYAMNSIFPGDNLIVTMETSKTQLNSEYVDALIEHYLK